MIRKFKKRILENTDLKEIAGKSFWSLGMRLGGIVINYLFLIYVTNIYGAQGWGIFALCYSILQIFSLFGTVGTHISLTKLIAEKKYQPVNLYKQSLLVTIPTTLILSLILYSLSAEISNWFGQDGIGIKNELKIASIGILPFSISMINAGVFRGMKQIVSYSFFDSFGRFLFGGLFLILFSFLLEKNSIFIIQSFVIGLFILMIISSLKVYVEMTRLTEPDQNKDLVVNELLRLSIPLLWTNFVSVGNIWGVTLILGVYLPKEDVGLFDTINRLTRVLTIILFSVNSITAPKFAESIDNIKLLRKNVNISTRLIFWSSLPVFIGMVFIGHELINLIGFSGFENAYIILLIIMTGQVVNNLSGSVGMLLQMIGYHKAQSTISSIVLFFNLIALILFVPKFGLLGAAVITGLDIAFKNLIAVIYTYRKTSINTLYIPRFLRSGINE